MKTPACYVKLPEATQAVYDRIVKSKPRPNGYILHEDAHRVIIATGFSTPSENRKTGPMIQVWILVKAEDPVKAVLSGLDRLVCGNCPLRARKATKTRKGKKRVCYVNVGQAPRGVWVKWHEGGYPTLPTFELFHGTTVRFGAWGDPTHLPFALAQAIAAVSSGWTGYSHQWRKPAFQPWRTLIQASVETDADKALAESMGWGVFWVIPRGSPHPTNATECLSDKSGIQCHDCLLCSGKGRSIFIEAHGSGAKYV